VATAATPALAGVALPFANDILVGGRDARELALKLR